MKTIREWLEELPEPYRTQALENASWKRLNRNVALQYIALSRAFSWALSTQGDKYWRDLYEKFKSDGK